MTTAEHVTVDALDAPDQRTPAWVDMREQERRIGTLPKGTYEAELRELALIKRKDNGGWVIRLIVRTTHLGRYVIAWQGLSENADDAFDLTDAQVRSLRRFADKMGIATPAPAEQIVEALRLMLGEPVTVRVSQTPVGQQATLSREAESVAAPPVVGRDLEAATRAAWVAHEKVVEGLSAARLGFAAAAEGCFELHQAEGWRALGFETLNEYLSSPEVTISRTDFYRLVEIWSAYVLTGGVEPVTLQGAGPTKLEVPLPALASGVVSAVQAVSDATTMTRKDLRSHYAALVGNGDADGAGEAEGPGDAVPALCACGAGCTDGVCTEQELGEGPAGGTGDEFDAAEVEQLRGYVRENQAEAAKAWTEVERLREQLESVTATLRRVFTEIGDPRQKRMSGQLRAAVADALALAQEYGLDVEVSDGR